MEPTHLSQAEFFAIHTSEANLELRVVLLLIIKVSDRPQLWSPRHQRQEIHLFPRAGAVGFPSAIHSCLVLAQVHQGWGQTAEVGHVVVQQLGCFVHLLIIAAITDLGQSTASLFLHVFSHCRITLNVDKGINAFIKMYLKAKIYVHIQRDRIPNTHLWFSKTVSLTCWICALLGPLMNSSSSARRFVLARAKINSVSTYDSRAFLRAICRYFTSSSQFPTERSSECLLPTTEDTCA